ncbi:hypothetical protein [Roseateles sp.]|uniref:hypothetical protein n=1 Tax=Roseateles sp. TaxID=1971397 RepID=UPI003D11341E
MHTTANPKHPLASTSASPSPETGPTLEGTQDPDLVEQARPGHGVPSQDPDPAAQELLSPAAAEREANSVLTGGGLVGGAAVGVMVGGPVGVVLGGSVGAVAGALGGAAAGNLLGTAEDKARHSPRADSDKAGV